MLQVMATSQYHDRILAEIKLQTVSSITCYYVSLGLFLELLHVGWVHNIEPIRIIGARSDVIAVTQ